MNFQILSHFDYTSVCEITKKKNQKNGQDENRTRIF